MEMNELLFDVVITRDEDEQEYVIHVPDLEGEIASRLPMSEYDESQLYEEAENAILVALQARIETREDIPRPTNAPRGSFRVSLGSLVALKLLLYRELRAAGMSRRELARHLGKNEVIVRRMLDLFHRSKSEQIEEALHVFGKRVVVSARTIPLPKAA